MNKYPFVKQKESKDCAVASVLMIIKYYKGFVPYDKLMETLKVTKNGTTAFHIVEGSKQMGFDCKGLKLNLDDLKTIIMPCIAHVIINKSYNHYIVIYEINYQKKYLIIADPNDKIKKITFNDFIKIWDNIIITFIPIKQIPIIYQNKNCFNILVNLFHTNKFVFIKILLVSLLITLLSVLSSYSFKFMIDSITELNPKNMLSIIFVSFIIIELFKSIFNYIQNRMLIFLSCKLDWFLTTDIFQKILLLPYHYYRNHTTGDITSRISDLKIVKDTTSKIIINIVTIIPLTIFSSIFLYKINKTLFSIALIMMLIYILIILIFKGKYDKLILKIQNENAITNSYLVESISGFETVKGLGIENEINNQFKDKYLDLSEVSLKLEKLINMQNIFKDLINGVGMLVIIYIGSHLVIENVLTLGSLIAFNSLICYFLEPIKGLLDISINLKEATNSFNRINEIITCDKEENKINKSLMGNISYHNTSYSYDNVTNVLNNINLKIKSKEKILIIGKSGSGKSTLLKLLLKFHEIKRNSIFIDDIDINDYSKTCLQDNICYISQNEILFTDTIYNNIKLNRNISDEKIYNITKNYYIDEIYKNSNLGVHTLVEENGFNLSGGERQRIVLGRSLVREFNVLIIDEGLNQVDVSLERKILKNIMKDYEDKTIIVISHRLENMDLFEKVIKFKNNTIEEDLIKNV